MFVKDAHDFLKVGDKVTVKVVSLMKRGRRSVCPLKAPDASPAPAPERKTGRENRHFENKHLDNKRTDLKEARFENKPPWSSPGTGS